MVKDIMKQAQKLWNDTLLEQRSEYLLKWANLLASQAEFGSLSAQMVDYQVQQGFPLINDRQLMPGPTGESNELYSAGRGMFLVSAHEGAPIEGLIGQICSVLLAGNSLVLSTMQPSLMMDIKSSLLAAGIPENVVAITPYSELELFIKTQEIAGVAYIGEQKMINTLDSLLAYKEGLLAQLIFEADLVNFSTITAPDYILRFISERTRTINVTAVGGNATLLALGSGD
ncbi:MAG: hypothetical protein V5786_02120 [Psychromonas sp.]